MNRKRQKKERNVMNENIYFYFKLLKLYLPFTSCLVLILYLHPHNFNRSLCILVLKWFEKSQHTNYLPLCTDSIYFEVFRRNSIMNGMRRKLFMVTTVIQMCGVFLSRLFLSIFFFFGFCGGKQLSKCSFNPITVVTWNKKILSRLWLNEIKRMLKLEFCMDSILTNEILQTNEIFLLISVHVHLLSSITCPLDSKDLIPNMLKMFTYDITGCPNSCKTLVKMLHMYKI